jgi:hypothetical protein
MLSPRTPERKSHGNRQAKRIDVGLLNWTNLPATERHGEYLLDKPPASCLCALPIASSSLIEQYTDINSPAIAREGVSETQWDSLTVAERNG